jgi:hypothetical protein
VERTLRRPLALLAVVAAILFAPLTATLGLPALLGEWLIRGALRRWPRIALLVGALVVWALVVVVAMFGALCGLGDDGNPHACDGVHRLTSWFVGIAAALTALACAWPRRTLRYALWATPTAMLASLIAFAL